MFIPQLVSLIPSYVFLEATLGIFNVRSDYPTWGRTIYEALRPSVVGWASSGRSCDRSGRGGLEARSTEPSGGMTPPGASYGSRYGSSYWVLEPLSLLLLTGLAFAMLGFGLERVLNPRTMGKAG